MSDVEKGKRGVEDWVNPDWVNRSDSKCWYYCVAWISFVQPNVARCFVKFRSRITKRLR